MHPKAVPSVVALLFMAAAFMGIVSSCGEQPTPPVSAGAAQTGGDQDAGTAADSPPDDAGDEPSAPPRDPRIVALSPAIAVILRDIGLERYVVGRHNYDLININGAPPVGEQDAIDYEALLAADPTHVLTQWGDRDLPPKLVKLAEENSWALHDYTLLDFDDVLDEADEIHTIFSDVVTERTPSTQLLESIYGFDPRFAMFFPGFEGDFAGRILLLASVDPPAALGPGSVHHRLLGSLVVSDHRPVLAITDGAPWQELDAEDILRIAPEGIILIDPWPASADRDAAASDQPIDLGRISSLPIPAIERGWVAVIDHPLAFLPATSLAEVANEMTDIVKEWFAQVEDGTVPPVTTIAP